MRLLRGWLVRFVGLFAKTRSEQELGEELAGHLQSHINDNLRLGMTPEEARRAALIKLGSIESLKATIRERRTIPAVESIVADVRLASRMLFKNPGFAFAAIATLAIGIGFNTALFTLLDAAVFSPLRVAEPERLVDIHTSDRNGRVYGTSSHPDYLDFKSRNEVFTDILAFTPAVAAVRVDGESRVAGAELVAGNYFDVLGVNAFAGRMLAAEDDQPGADRVVVISHRFWVRKFDAHPGAVGKTIRIRGQVYTIVGVAPPQFTGMLSVFLPELWVPVTWVDEVETIGLGAEAIPSPGNSALDRRGNRFLLLKGRLKPRETVARAAANFRVIMEQLSQEYPGTNRDRRVAMMKTNDVSIHPDASQPVRLAALGLMAIVGLVLFIACTNVASMLLARASARQKEFGIRLAIGAGRRRLIQQLLTESVLLSFAGALAAIAFARAILRTAISIPTPLGIPVGLNLHVDARVFTFTAALAALAGLIAGVVPALRATRPDVIGELKGVSFIARVGRRRWTLRDGLVAAQIAVTLILLVAAGLLTRSTIAAQRIDLGFHTNGVASIAVPLNLVGYDDQRANQFYDRALDRIRAIPGVEFTALTWRVPLGQNFSLDRIVPSGREVASAKNPPIDTTSVSPGYFSTLGVPLLQGRDFTAADTATSQRVAIINETMARRFWPNESAIGQRFRVAPSSNVEYEIVGVSADYKVRSVGEPPAPYIHYAISQGRAATIILARTNGDAGALAATIRRELRQIDPDIVFSDTGQTLQESVSAALAPAGLAALGMTIFGVIAMMLTAVGLYGAIAYLVSQRRHEIGIRLAIGAEPRAVLWLVVCRGLAVVCAGILIGAPLALGAARLMSALLYGISALDPLAWIGALAVLFASATAANIFPARRAARLDPSIALRAE